MQTLTFLTRPPLRLLRALLHTLLCFLVLPFCLMAAAAMAQESDYVAGRDYVVIDPPLPVRVAPGKVEIIEFFNFSCPHCFRLQRPFHKWQSERDMSDITIVRVPIVFQQTGGHYARAYYTLESLNAADELYTKMFGAIHRERKLLNSKGRFVDWLEEQGYDAAAAEAAYDSFSVSLKASRTTETAAAYGVDSTPQLAVGGKYVINAVLAGSRERMLDILSALVALERKAQQ
ncbi:MAG: thiol:disulfide interchange protein DsbA/DsbL [Gammaproteobacteria bacterium]